MKNPYPYILVSILFLLTYCSAISQNEVPVKVQENFEKKYPGENDPDWHIDKNGNFESHFKIDGEKYRADFSPNGNWIETENNIKKKELPKAIKRILNKKYKDVKIYEIEKVDHFSKGIFYDVELKIDGKKKDIEFKGDGSVIN